MNIEKQTELAKKFTDDLLKYIVNANCKKLNVDGKGCSVSSIDIRYFMDETILDVKFESNDSSVSSFTCVSRI